MLRLTILTCVLAVLAAPPPAPAAPPRPPNVIFILADDIGYGDLGCYGATKHRTPHCDRLAREGTRFTDGHAPSAVCTPTRYAFMTGEYAWRKPNTGILSGEAGLIIEPGRTTVASMLKRAGYATGVVGKWHLGLGTHPTDYNVDIRPGPLDIGFDEAWLLPATGDRTPCVWIDGRRVAGLDPADPIRLDYSVQRGEPRSFVAGIPRIGAQEGGRTAIWKDEEIADVIAAKGVDFIERHRDGPFFLFFNTHDIHVPRAPHPRFRGTSDTGVRGDAVHSFDWTVGRILEALDRLRIAEDTLVILTSDNGGTLDNNGPDVEHGVGSPHANDGHAHNGPLRGGKGSVSEGGTRVPFIVRWPARVRPGTSDALVSHVDMLASLAAIVGQPLAEADGPDSIDVSPALLDGRPGRTELVEHGRGLALRMGTWKYVPARSAARRAAARAPELYDLAADIGETRNVVGEQPDIAARMEERLTAIEREGRSRPAGNAATAPRRPNIVYVIIDELGYYEPSYMGNPNIRTPNIDRLAGEGVRCRNVMAGSSVCAPTRCCLLTGKHSGHTSVRSNGGGTPLRAEEPTIASMLKPLGYATGGFGKWGCGGRGSTGVPELHGFDVFLGYYDQVHAHTYYPPYLIRNSREIPLAGNNGGNAGAVYSQYVIHEAALNFIREHATGPFFAYLPYTPPHGNFSIPDDDPAWAVYRDKPWPEQARRYAAMVTMIDRQVGEVVDLLRELGVEENTMIFFSGDNGGADYFASPERPRGLHLANKHPRTGVEFRGAKGSLYEGGVRVPFFVRWKGTIAPGRVSDHLGYFPDVMPTIAEATGATCPADTDGISLMPELLGERVAGRPQKQHDYLYWELNGWTAIRQGDWRAVRPNRSRDWELYDLSSDPAESKDLAATAPERLAKLVALASQAHRPAVEGTFASTAEHERDRRAKSGRHDEAGPPTTPEAGSSEKSPRRTKDRR